jgi:hypothetical protein
MAYYLLSAPLTPERFNEILRQHWGVENPPRLTLAPRCGHERGPGQNPHGPLTAEPALLRHMVINAMQEEGSKGSLRGKFKRAG